MIYNYKNSLSICHGFQITYLMSQQLSMALIIEFVETFNREVKIHMYVYVCIIVCMINKQINKRSLPLTAATIISTRPFL